MINVDNKDLFYYGQKAQWQHLAQISGASEADLKRLYWAVRFKWEKPKPKVPDVIAFKPRRDYLAEACAQAGISVEIAKGPRGVQRIANKRHHVMWYLRNAGLSFPTIGRMLNRDHSTAMHGVHKHELRAAQKEAAE